MSNPTAAGPLPTTAAWSGSIERARGGVGQRRRRRSLSVGRENSSSSSSLLTVSETQSELARRRRRSTAAGRDGRGRGRGFRGDTDTPQSGVPLMPGNDMASSSSGMSTGHFFVFSPPRRKSCSVSRRRPPVEDLGRGSPARRRPRRGISSPAVPQLYINHKIRNVYP